MSAPEGDTTRKERIKQFIVDHPGTHLREICREMSIAVGVAEYHLNRLEKQREIVSRRRGLYRRYYANLVFAERDQDILDVLSQGSEREILLFLSQRPGVTQKDMADFAKLSPATVNWHVKRLVGSGLIEARLGNDSLLRYFVSVDRSLILKLLKAYHPAIWQSWADRLADVWLDFSNLSGEQRAPEKFEY